MPPQSAIILANALEVWRQIDAENLAEHALWVFMFQSACPLQSDAQSLLHELAEIFTSSAAMDEGSGGWVVKATSSIRQIEMNQSQLTSWVDSASRLSKASGCQLTAWEIVDVNAKKVYRSEISASS